MAVEPTRRLFTVDEFHRMAGAGIFHPDDRVELLDGEIYEMTPIGPHHAGSVGQLARILIEFLAGRAVVRVQDPVVLEDRSEPQPDVAVARLRDDRYFSAHPGPDDLHLVIEVADTTQLFDRNRKVPRYAQAGILETWLLDQEAEHLEIYSDPTPDGYAERRIARRGESASPQAFPDVVIDVDDILPPRASEAS